MVAWLNVLKGLIYAIVRKYIVKEVGVVADHRVCAHQVLRDIYLLLHAGIGGRQRRRQRYGQLLAGEPVERQVARRRRGQRCSGRWWTWLDD